MKVKVINKSKNNLPFYATKGSAGMDVYSNEELELEPLSTTIVKTGLFVKIPEGYEIQVRPRSGLSAKSSLRIANSPGTIDSDYLGEIGIIVDNTSQKFSYTVKKGERVKTYEHVMVSEIDHIKAFASALR
jgi:dUTP pyrophosphatase